MSARSEKGCSGFLLNPRVLSLAAAAIVVLVLAVLQYHWIGAVSDAQEALLKTQVKEDARLLADGFDTEMTRAAAIFDIPFAGMPSGFGEIEQAWEAWRRDAPWPGIISGIAFISSAGSEWRSQWLGRPGVSDLRGILPAQAPAPGPLQPVIVRGANRELHFDGQPALLLPLGVLSERPGSFTASHVLIRFDLDYVKRVVFPSLLKERTTPEESAGFQFDIVSKDEGGSSPSSQGDIVIDLFLYRPDCLPPRPFSPSARPTNTSRLKLSPDAGTHILHLPSPVTQPLPLDFLVRTAGQCRAPQPSSESSLLKLVVSQRNSWHELYSRFRWRNLLLSGFALAVLLAGMSVLVISAERARRLARLQTVIAAGISHELRTPLASLRLAADDLKSGYVDSAGQARRYGEIVDTQSRRLGHVVDQALFLTSAERSHGSRSLRAVSVSEIFDAAVNTLEPRITAAQMEVEIRVEPGVPNILADSELVVRSLTNLIENATKYAGAGGRIVLSCGRGGRQSGREMVEVTVEDRGPGIRADESKAVFEPFYRGASARQSRETGSGLGLAIAKDAVEANGGWIKLERAEPHGCRFRLFFFAHGAEVAR